MTAYIKSLHTGSGETDDGLHSIFRAAWEAQPDTPVPIYGSGYNILPTIHIADLAAYIAAVCIEPPVQQYLLAVDNAQLSQRKIVAAIADKMGSAPVREQTLEELYFQQVYFPPDTPQCHSDLITRCPNAEEKVQKYIRTIAAQKSFVNEIQKCMSVAMVGTSQEIFHVDQRLRSRINGCQHAIFALTFADCSHMLCCLDARELSICC